MSEPNPLAELERIVSRGLPPYELPKVRFIVPEWVYTMWKEQNPGHPLPEPYEVAEDV